MIVDDDVYNLCAYESIEGIVVQSYQISYHIDLHNVEKKQKD